MSNRGNREKRERERERKEGTRVKELIAFESFNKEELKEERYG